MQRNSNLREPQEIEIILRARRQKLHSDCDFNSYILEEAGSGKIRD